MKQRFSSLDVKVIAHELFYLLSTLRLTNIYDLSSRIFLIKFAKPGRREALVIDQGFRCHLTKYARSTAATPSAFVARLRKLLRTRRVSSISQVGTDRIIEFQFSDGQFRLFLEFYAGGNIILTDRDLSIVTLLRVVDGENEKLRIGFKYSLENRQNYDGIPLTLDRVRARLQLGVDKDQADVSAFTNNLKRKSGNTLRKAIATTLTEIPPVLIDHVLRTADLDAKTLIHDVLEDHTLLSKLHAALCEARKLVESITESRMCQGYIIAKPVKSSCSDFQEEATGGRQPTHNGLIYEDFQPFRAQQLQDAPEMIILEVDGFNRTVDEFFSSIEAQKLESKLVEREENAKRKLETARLDHEKRLDGLQHVQELNVRKAQAIEANAHAVQEAITSINGLLAQGMDWVDVARLIEMEQIKNNVVAEMIKLPLKLFENTATLLLPETTSDDDSEFDEDKTNSDFSDQDGEDHSDVTDVLKMPRLVDNRLAIDVDLALSPWSNARLYYDHKKSAAVKQQKTLQSSERALKSTEKKINADLKKGLRQEKEVLRPQRRASWFEKFIYFISSEGYLVIGGKDAAQNETLYRKHLENGDVYIHADLSGAAIMIVKNRPETGNSRIPPCTLSQAGTLAVVTSSAWDSKAVMSAWWVNPEQVSKMGPTGEYLPIGAFTVQGQKNFLPPAQLSLGFGLLFRLSEESKARRLRHRIQDNTPKTLDLATKGTDQGQGIQIEADVHYDKVQSNAEDYSIANGYDEHQSSHSHTLDEAESVNTSDSETDNSDSEAKSHNPLQPIQNMHQTLQLQASGFTESKALVKSDHAKWIGSETCEGAEANIRNRAQNGNGTNLSNKEKPHVSAWGREHLRQGQSVPTSDPIGIAFEKTDEDTTHQVNFSRKNQSTLPSKSSHPTAVRGKHNKRNKFKLRYADQDEEDQALAMRLLGSTKATEDAAIKLSKEQEIARQKERRRKQHILTAQKGKEAEERRNLDFQRSVETSEEAESNEVGDIDAFVGVPHPGDEILDALVMCGPWDAMGGRCRWRAKLQPGTTKKGKAVKEVLGRWVSNITEREKKKRTGSGEGNENMVQEEEVMRKEGELIRAIREPEIIGVIPVSKVRVLMGPGEASGRGKGNGGAGRGRRGGRGSKR